MKYEIKPVSPYEHPYDVIFLFPTSFLLLLVHKSYKISSTPALLSSNL